MDRFLVVCLLAACALLPAAATAGDDPGTTPRGPEGIRLAFPGESAAAVETRRTAVAELETAVSALRALEAARGDIEKVAAARQRYAIATRRLRAQGRDQMRARLEAAGSEAARQQRGAQIVEQATKAVRSFELHAPTWARAIFAASVDAVEKAKRLGALEGAWRAYRVLYQAMQDVHTRLLPLDATRNRAAGLERSEWFWRPATNRAVVRMDDLAKRIVETDPDAVDDEQTREQKEAQTWFRRRRREIDKEEYTRLAIEAPMLWPDTREPVTGKLRIEIARNAEANLGYRLASAAVRSRIPFHDLFFADPRIAEAAKIAAKVKNTPEYVLLNYLTTGAEPPPAVYFLAAARAIRHEQELMHKWFDEGYLPKRWMGLGLATTARLLDLTGKTSATAVRKVLDEFYADADAAAGALDAAGSHKTHGPSDLTAAQQRLLEKYGYIRVAADGSKSFAIPTSSRRLGGLRGSLDLPGAHFMDVVNPENVVITIASVVLPEVASARLAQLAETVIGGRSAVMATRVLANLAAGAALSGTIEVIQKGKVDVERILIETFLVGTIAQGASRVAEIGGIAAVARGPLASWLRGNEAAMQQAVKWVGSSMGLATDSAIQAYWQAHLEKKHVDFATYLACLTNGALARVVATKFDQLQNREWLPEFLRTRAIEEPAFYAHVRDRATTLAKLIRGAKERYHAATDGGRDPSPLRLFLALGRGEISWSDLKIVYESDVQGMTTTMSRIRDLRDSHFRSLLLEAYADAKRMAHFDHMKELEEIAADPVLSSEDKEARSLASKRRYENDLALIHEGFIQPGSNEPTSDIDRSLSSPYTRKALIRISETKWRMNDAEWIPTTARAFDVNEYIDVLPFILETAAHRGKMRGLPADDGPPSDTPAPHGPPRFHGEELSHGEAMEALGYASAMLHMTDARARDYQRGVVVRKKERLERKGLPPETIERVLESLRGKLRAAERSRLRGQVELQEEMQALHLVPSDPESEVRARTSLYDKRMDALRQGLWELGRPGVDQGSPEALAKRAHLERELKFALREGVETYSDPVGLDLILQRVQMATHTVVEDGRPVRRKMKPRDRIEDERFTLNGELRGVFTDIEIQGVIRDQVMFMVEHVRAWREGQETTFQCGRALAKYGERVVLAQHILGTQIHLLDHGHPLRVLHEVTQRLVAAKGNPDRFHAMLQNLSKAEPHTPDNGLIELFGLLERAVPGMEHQTGPLPGAPRPRSAVVMLGWDRSVESLRRMGGSAACVAREELELDATRTELARARERLRTVEALLSRYGATDWKTAEKLEVERRQVDLVVNCVPWMNTKDPHVEQLNTRLKAIDGELGRMKAPFRPAGGVQTFRDGEVLVLRARVRALEAREQSLQRAIPKDRERRAREAKLDAYRLTGLWTIGKVPTPSAKVRVVHEGREVTMRILWLPDDAEHARFEVRATARRGVIDGLWEDRKVHPTTWLANGNAHAGRTGGRFHAELALDGKSFTVTKTTEEYPDGPFRWRGSVFYLVEPGPAAALTPADFMRLEAKPVPQRSERPLRASGEGLERGVGRLYFEARGADGLRVGGRVKLYEAGTRTFVDHGRIGGALEIEPGTYDVSFPVAPTAWVRGVRVAAGDATTVAAPVLGRLLVKTELPRGRKSDDLGLSVRIYKGKQAVGTARQGDPVDLVPGTYSVTATRSDLRSPLWTKEVTVAARTEAELTFRFGGVTLASRDGKGQPFHASATLYREGETAGQSLSHPGGAFLPLSPGTYKIQLKGPKQMTHATVAATVRVLGASDLRADWGRIRVLVRPSAGVDRGVVAMSSKGKGQVYAIFAPGEESIERDVPPGTWKVVSQSAAWTLEKTVDVTAGHRAEVSFEPP